MKSNLLKFPRLSIALFLFVALLCPALRAQKDTGSIVGTVRDASGAIVTGAKVTVRDVERGTSFVTSSNDAGEYLAGPLKIGRYTVSIEKEGFKTAVAGPAGQPRRRAFRLFIFPRVSATSSSRMLCSWRRKQAPIFPECCADAQRGKTAFRFTFAKEWRPSRSGSALRESGIFSA